MSNDSKQAAFVAGEFSSEDAVRGALGRRRTPARTNNRGARAAKDRASSSVRRTASLRRWSVADLIARAIAPPAGSAVRH